jgi:hypothetical protein
MSHALLRGPSAVTLLPTGGALVAAYDGAALLAFAASLGEEYALVAAASGRMSPPVLPAWSTVAPSDRTRQGRRAPGSKAPPSTGRPGPAEVAVAAPRHEPPPKLFLERKGPEKRRREQSEKK